MQERPVRELCATNESETRKIDVGLMAALGHVTCLLKKPDKRSFLLKSTVSRCRILLMFFLSHWHLLCNTLLPSLLDCFFSFLPFFSGVALGRCFGVKLFGTRGAACPVLLARYWKNASLLFCLLYMPIACASMRVYVCPQGHTHRSTHIHRNSQTLVMINEHCYLFPIPQCET